MLLKSFFCVDYLIVGEPFTLLDKENFLFEDAARFYLADITLALEHLHKNGIIHRDLKPENIILNANGHIRLIDFGMSKESIHGEKTLCGTVEYIAPEIIQRTAYGKAVNWWSFRALMIDMLTGNPPFCD
jgi:p70 ribosomal S6 kinase